MFSKLDLRWGFHQIELEPNSRDITSFATDDGIFRYKRLSFGVNAAPEKYQHIITQTMAGLKGRSKGLLTRHGIGPSKEKIRTVVEASEPQSQSEGGGQSSRTWSSTGTREEWGASCCLLCQPHLKQC